MNSQVMELISHKLTFFEHIDKQVNFALSQKIGLSQHNSGRDDDSDSTKNSDFKRDSIKSNAENINQYIYGGDSTPSQDEPVYERLHRYG